jgi:hypothetical protein
LTSPSVNERAGHVLLGILQIALLRAEGLGQFGDSPKSFLNSLAPLIAFPLAGGLLGVLSGAGLDAVAALLGTLVALLAPPVLSEMLAGSGGGNASGCATPPPSTGRAGPCCWRSAGRWH